MNPSGRRALRALLTLGISALITRARSGSRQQERTPGESQSVSRPTAPPRGSRTNQRPGSESTRFTESTVTSDTDDLAPSRIPELTPQYAPELDGDPDPGEIVWTWVPFEEHDGRGKDRPVLIIARLDSNAVVGCALSTKEHRGFVSVGSGKWDSSGRESFLNPDRLLRVTNTGMRREGHVLSKDRFDAVVHHLSPRYGFRA